MKISDCPFRPGTPEHNEWIKDQAIPFQRMDRETYVAAKAIADGRLAKLKETYPVGVILDPDIDHLVNGTPEPTVLPFTPLTPIYAKHTGRLLDINQTWVKTEQYVVINSMLAYMPQIDNAPDWVSDKQLYAILVAASRKDVEEIKQQHGYIFYAVSKPLSLQMALNPNQLSVDQVRVKFEKWMR
jgi:hypothetical protein